jgi:hypothetical protein
MHWDIGGLYCRHSSEAHSRLLSDLIDAMLPAGRQLRSDAHPLCRSLSCDRKDGTLPSLEEYELLALGKNRNPISCDGPSFPGSLTMVRPNCRMRRTIAFPSELPPGPRSICRITPDRGRSFQKCLDDVGSLGVPASRRHLPYCLY